MKKLFLLSVLAVILILSFNNCRKDDMSKEFEPRFYTTTPNQKLILFINGDNKGVLPFMQEPLACNGTTDEGVSPLIIHLKSGTYKYEAKTESGQTKSSGEFYLSGNKVSCTSKLGGSGLSETSECMKISIFE